MVRPETTKPPRAPRRVVYTALIGEYEALNEQPTASESDIDFVCFTDNPTAVSDSWQIRLVEPRFPLDAIRSARYLKVKGPELLSDYDESLWIDNSVLLRAAPGTILDEWLATTDAAIPVHSYRTSVLGEFDTVAAQGYDDPARVYEQLIHYSSTSEKVLGEVPYWTALLARRHTPAVLETMALWFDQILRYSRRDQLSINYVVDRTNLAVTPIVIDNWSSVWHQWPILADRKWSVTQDRLAGALRVPQADIGRLENLVTQLRAENAAITEEKNRAVGTIGDMRRTASWKITRPFRWVMRKLRGG
jgi:hypothetical protein